MTYEPNGRESTNEGRTSVVELLTREECSKAGEQHIQASGEYFVHYEHYEDYSGTTPQKLSRYLSYDIDLLSVQIPRTYIVG